MLYYEENPKTDNNDIIESVKGLGKGKYRFKYNNDVTHLTKDAVDSFLWYSNSRLLFFT